MMPDRNALEAFRSALFRYAASDTYISLRAFRDDRRSGAPVLIEAVKVCDPRLLDRIYARAREAAEHEVPATFCPPIATFRGPEKASEVEVANGLSLSIDCDKTPEQSRAKLVAVLGEPTIGMESGGECVDPSTGEVQSKLHLHWRLCEPTQKAADHALLKELRKVASRLAGSDASAVPLSHPLRWPGSVHRKRAPRLARVVSQSENELDLRAALHALRDADPQKPKSKRDGPERQGLVPSRNFSACAKDIAAALVAIPNDDLPWEDWNRIAMAAWNASEGDAFEAFDRWSQKSVKYDPAYTFDRWEHLGSYPPDDIGAGTLFYMARKVEPSWRKPSVSRLEPHLLDEGNPRSGTESNSRAGAASSNVDDRRPVIRLEPGKMAQTVDAVEDALASSDFGIYQRDGQIVCIGVSQMLTAQREAVSTLRIQEVGEHRLLELAMASARFEKWDARARAFRFCSPGLDISRTLHDRRGVLRLPVLSGLLNAPTLRGDGSVLEVVGYDASTGLFYEPAEVCFPPLARLPTRENALAALNRIDGLLDGFPFVSSADRSVALSAILTATVRKSLPTAPAFGFSAPVAGTGKSKLVDIMSVIATGREAGVIAFGNTADETEKRVAALLLSGNAIAIDNADCAVDGELLCQLLTQKTVRVRVLGRSKTPELQTNVTVTFTGNNLMIRGDMTRRTLVCELDPKTDRPELRTFDFDPVAKARDDRAELLVSALTVIKSFHEAGRPVQTRTLGGFEEWSDLVRGALVWLGRADPVGTIERSRTYDPQADHLRAVMVQWDAEIGEESVTASEAVRRANLQPNFYEAARAATNSSGALDVGKFGTWLGRSKGRFVDGTRFMPGTLVSGVKRWRLEKSPQAGGGTTDADRLCQPGSGP